MNGWMEGRVCLVTGASSGIGKEIATGLARMDARLVILCRDHVRGRAAQAEIRDRTGNPHVDLLVADLTSQEAIRQAAAEFLRRNDRLDVLVNNAGTISARRRITVDGWETTLAVNHLAPHLLTTLLMDCLKATAPSRIVNLTSASHATELDLDNLNGERGYNPLRAYAATKLMNVLFTFELAQRIEGSRVSANCVHPGGARTALFRDFTGAFPRLLSLTRPFMVHPKRAARAPLYLATSASVEGVSGKYFVRTSEGRPARIAAERALARKLWDLSAQMVGVPSDPGYPPQFEVGVPTASM